MSINAKQINDMARQIRYTTDCEVLLYEVREHLKSVTDDIAAMVKEQASLLEKILPILSLPSPDPISIVKWLGKLVLGTAYPQLKAYVSYAIQLIEMAQALQNIIAAVQEIGPKLEECAAQVTSPEFLLNEALNQVNNATNGMLSKIEQTQVALQNIVGETVALVTFDTSSPQAFIGSAATKLDLLNSQLNDEISAPIPPPPEP